MRWKTAQHACAKGGNQVRALRRRLSNLTGEVALAGTVARERSKGDGSTAALLVDGRAPAVWQLRPAQAVAFRGAAVLAPNSTLDPIVTPENGTDTDFDATRATLTIIRSTGSQ